MKTTKLAIGLLTLATLCQASPAFAYLSADQVFGGTSLTLDAPPPPTMREGADVVNAQQQRSAQLRNAAQAELPSLDDEEQDTYVAPKTSATRGLFDQNTVYDRRQERISDRGATPTIIITGNGGAITDANGNVLHSGAPRISDTGPEHVFMAVLGLALLGMAAYVWRRTHAVHSIMFR